MDQEYHFNPDNKLFRYSDTDSTDGKSDFDDEYHELKPPPKEFKDNDIVTVKPASWADIVKQQSVENIMNTPEKEPPFRPITKNTLQQDNLQNANVTQHHVSNTAANQYTLSGSPLLRPAQQPIEIRSSLSVQQLQAALLQAKYNYIPANTAQYVPLPSSAYVNHYGIYNRYPGYQQTNMPYNFNSNNLQQNNSNLNYNNYYNREVPCNTNSVPNVLNQNKSDMEMLENFWPSSSDWDHSLYNERNKIFDLKDLMLGIEKDAKRDIQLFYNVNKAFMNEKFVKRGSCVYFKMQEEKCDGKINSPIEKNTSRETSSLYDEYSEDKCKEFPEMKRKKRKRYKKSDNENEITQKEFDKNVHNSSACPKCNVTDTDLLLYRLALIFLILLVIFYAKMFLNVLCNIIVQSFISIFFEFSQFTTYLITIIFKLIYYIL